MKKTLSAIMAALTLLSVLASCAQDAENPKGGSSDPTVTTVSETTPDPSLRENAKDNLPDGLNLEGETIHIHSFSAETYDILGKGEECGDVVFDAVYKRTRSVSERLNANITWSDSEHQGWVDFSASLESTIMAGDDAWQMVFAQGNSTIQSNRDHLFRDLSDAQYLDLDQPWWWQDAMEEVSFDSVSRRYLIGDIALTNFLRAGCVYFNKNLYGDTFGDPDELYGIVVNNEWTMDKMTQLCEEAYQDINGNGMVDDADVHGLLFGARDYAIHLEYAFDVQHYYRDEAGYPVVEYDLERAQLAVDKMYKLLYSTFGSAFSSTTVPASAFAERKTFFFGNQIVAAVGADLRNMEDDYGIIPYPKLDEEQENYENLLYNSSSVVTVPVTAQSVSETCAVIEAMCAESYRSVVEVFYEQALKMKYSRDSHSGQCIDIIRDVTKKNLVYEYSAQIGYSGTLIGGCITDGITNIASRIAAQVPASNKLIQSKIESWEKMNQQ